MISNYKKTVLTTALIAFLFLLSNCANPLTYNQKSLVSDGQLVQTTLEWDPNTEPDLAGYKLYYGLSSGDYQYSVDAGNQTTYTLTDLEAGKTYYIAATAYNTTGLESDYSDEVVFNSPG